MLDTYGIVVVAFLVKNKANWVRFFEETFLVANISLKEVFRISFLTLSGADVDFLGRELWYKIYITKKAFPTTRHVKLVGKKEFAAAVLDPKYKTYIVYIGSVSSNALLSSSSLDIHPLRRLQISGLIAKEAFTKIPVKYLDFADIFSPDLAFELPKYTGINNHIIKLVNSQQPLYRPIYSLRPVELETMKAYIETNLANRFIKPFKSPANASILFNRKLDGFFWLCVNY